MKDTGKMQIRVDMSSILRKRWKRPSTRGSLYVIMRSLMVTLPVMDIRLISHFSGEKTSVILAKSNIYI
jgi:hypothetical protein